MTGDESMADSMVKWFSAHTGDWAKPIRRGDYMRLFYIGDKEAEQKVVSLYASNNGKSLYVPSGNKGSLWQRMTLPAAMRIDKSPDLAASAIKEACGDGYFEALSGLKGDFEAEYPQISRSDEYQNSRLKTWLGMLELPGGDKTRRAEAAAHVFAEMVFGDDSGLRPDGGRLALELMDRGSGAGGNNANNIFMTSRRELEGEGDLEKLLDGALCVRLLNFAATSFVYDKTVSSDPHHRSRYTFFMESARKGTVFQLILPAPDSYSELDAGTTKAVEAYPGRTGLDIIRQMRERLMEEIEQLGVRQGVRPIQLHFTKAAIPYALMIATFGDPARDFAKVDLYSPYLTRDSDRRSFIVWREKDPENYEFFYNNFAEIWKEDSRLEKVFDAEPYNNIDTAGAGRDNSADKAGDGKR